MKNIIIISLAIFLTSCAPLSLSTHQNLGISFRIKEGMSKNEVETIMGQPVKSDFYKNVDEWHYCSTGDRADQFIALFFFEDKLIAKLNYTVTDVDTRGVYGSCETFIKMGNYREPDNVTEIRVRY